MREGCCNAFALYRHEQFLRGPNLLQKTIGRSLSTAMHPWSERIGSAARSARTATKSRFISGSEARSFAPPETVVRGMLAKAAVHGTKAPGESAFKLMARVPRQAGCRSTPLVFGQIELKSDGSLPNSVVLSERQDRPDGISMVAKYIQHLQNNGSCKATNDPSLITCVGSRTENGKTINFLFMVVSAGGVIVQSASGIPVHVRCDELGASLFCVVADDFENGVAARSLVDPKGLSAGDVRGRHERLIKFVAERRVP
jgi:hypothetical protein